MKPHRMRMVHDLIVNYDIHRKLDMCVCPPPTESHVQCSRFVDYETGDLAGNDEVSYG